MSPWNKNLTKMPGYKEGNLRGIQGTGNEMLAIARALKHGFIVFLKAWPDTNYDLVIDNNSKLFRVEVKGTGTGKLNLTRGQRAGKQISRAVKSRTRLLNEKDCDVVIGVNARNGECYIIPIKHVMRTGRKSESLRNLSPFKEKWDILRKTT